MGFQLLLSLLPSMGGREKACPPLNSHLLVLAIENWVAIGYGVSDGTQKNIDFKVKCSGRCPSNTPRSQSA
jgi:hypothetical protein